MSVIKKIKKFAVIMRNKIILRKICKSADINEKTVVNSASGIKNSGPKENIKISKHCVFYGVIYALCGGRVIVGENTYIGTKAYILAKEEVRIGTGCMIANDVVICDNNTHPIDPEARWQMSLCDDFINDEKWSWKDSASAPVILEDNTWIGRRAMIMKGVTVGKGSIVGAGAVVTHDVPPYTVAAGNPAKVVKELKKFTPHQEVGNT